MKLKLQTLGRSDGFNKLMSSLISILVGLLVGGIVVLIVGLVEPKITGSGIWDGIRLIFGGILSTGRDAAGTLTWGFNAQNIGNMLFRATPLIMTGLSVAIAFKTGLFNIGAAGQYTVGAFCALFSAIVLKLPWWACLLASAIGGAICFIFAPLGFGDWQSTVATITGLIAKEEVVNTFGVLYQYAGEADLLEDSHDIWMAIGADFGAMTAYSFMIFNLLCAPCFAAMGAIKREMNNVKWTLGAIGYMCGFAYVVSMIVYQLGGLITGEAVFSLWTVVAVAALAGILFLLFRKGYQGEHETHNLTSVAAAAK